MNKKRIALSVVVAALVLSLGCVTVFAAESDAFSDLTGQQADAQYGDDAEDKTGCATGQEAGASYAPEAEDGSAYSYLTGRQNSANRNDLYAQAEELPEDERDAFLAENGIGETPWSEEAAASYSYVGGQQRGASYRQDDDADASQDMSGYSYLAGQQRGSSYHK